MKVIRQRQLNKIFATPAKASLTQKKKNTTQILKQRCSLALLVSTDLKVLAPLDGVLRHMFATLTLKPQDNLFCCLGLLVENGLGLSSIT